MDNENKDTEIVFGLSPDNGEHFLANENEEIFVFDSPGQAEQWCKENGYDYDSLLLISFEVLEKNSKHSFCNSLDNDTDCDYDLEEKLRRYLESDN